MPLTKVYATKSAEVDFNNQNQNISNNKINDGYKDLFVGVDKNAFPESVKYKRISKVNIFMYLRDYHGYEDGRPTALSYINVDFDEKTLTYANQPYPQKKFYERNIYKRNVPGYYEYSAVLEEEIKNVIEHGFIFNGLGNVSCETTRGANRPYIEIDHENDITGIGVSLWDPVAKDGTVALAEYETEFEWSEIKYGPTISPLQTVTRVFEWRPVGGTIQRLTPMEEGRLIIPAGTFKSEEIEWRISITANSGVTNVSQWEKVKVQPPEIRNEAPQSGYVPKFKNSKFSWSLIQVKDPKYTSLYENIPQSSADFKWRPAGTGVWNTIAVQTEKGVTVPAGTFTSDEIEWKVVAKTEHGITVETAVYKLSTIEEKSTARIKSPKDTIIDSSIENCFEWEHIISTGTLPTGYDIQTRKKEMDPWVTLKSEKTQETKTAIPARTFTGGDVFWKVRTYNTDDKPGEWSPEAHFIAIAAPERPPVVVDREAPKFIIRWQQAEQQAYEITINGKVTEQKFGKETRYESDKYLPDGTYEIGVRVQNKYGMWSEFGTVALRIKNAAGEKINLNIISKENVAKLKWFSNGEYEKYLIYRNDKLIGESYREEFTDRFSAGRVSYKVRGTFKTGGNYTMSQTIESFVEVKAPIIAKVREPEWLNIMTSTENVRVTSMSANKNVTYNHFAGQELPSATIGEYQDKKYNFAVAWRATDRESIEIFESMLGELVCVKLPSGRVVVGILDEIETTGSIMIVEERATITLVEWEEGKT